jgi:hypothetical protein
MFFRVAGFAAFGYCGKLASNSVANLRSSSKDKANNCSVGVRSRLSKR